MSTPPRLPDAPGQYDQRYLNELLRALRIYFNGVAGVQPVRAAALNIDVDRLPTQAQLATLRRGDVYRDTSADNALKIKI